MVKTVSITNFKSIRDLKFDAKRVNLFIGEPNAGKSNIIEALSLLSLDSTKNLSSVVRFDRLANLFLDNDIKNNIAVCIDEHCLAIESKSREIYIMRSGPGSSAKDELVIQPSGKLLDKKGLLFEFTYFVVDSEKYKPYHFKRYEAVTATEDDYSSTLKAPYGENLAEQLIYHSALREFVSSMLQDKGYKLNLDPSRGEINMIKEQDGVLYTYPYRLFSDTLQRIIFYFAAIESNQNAVLLFEEPEANTFPYYTKQLAERIALDTAGNQFFIATHNPYLIASMVEKTLIADMSVNIVYMNNYQTKLYQLADEQLDEILDQGPDVFYNLERFLPEV
ncbi:ATP/GTP-binding protein [uncultured Fibrella sp.]|uniref:AAA family ATPase n=1 Tax=uncultured Fibrella sp. TaxID=1284596 RepID=UPI0035CB5DE1